MGLFAVLFLTGIGLTLIYAGYKLFCELPAMAGPGGTPTTFRALLLNIVPGALLALAGVGLIASQARGFMSHRSAIHRGHTAEEGAAWHRGESGRILHGV
jgi:hypothetical protein